MPSRAVQLDEVSFSGPDTSAFFGEAVVAVRFKGTQCVYS